MKSTLATVTLLVVLLTMLNVKSVLAQSTPTPTTENRPPESNNIIQTNIHSTILGEDRRVIIHLPRNYSKDAQKYPVMYVLDGTSQDGHTADKINVLSDAGLVPAAIVVGLPNTRGNRERDQTPPFMRRIVDDEESAYGAGDKFLSFIEKELIPFIDNNYRTSGYRTLSGNSRGGLLVLYSFMEKPALFQAWFCYSTPVWRFENLMVNKMSQSLLASSDLRGFFYISVGDKETDQMIGGFNKLVDVLRKHRKKQFRWVADHTPYAVHQDNALISTSKGLTEWGKYLAAKRINAAALSSARQSD
jgi:predicted alpha/beta superfamily hydrolase